jgi:formamidopyrimidine-DNA glycosylase
MPELPEVETTRLGLMPLVGKIVKAVAIRHSTLRWPIPQHLLETLPGQTLHGLTRRAKYILAKFDNGTLLLHLGMSGRLCLLDDLYPAEKHDHFDIVFTDKQVLRLRDPRRFGAVLWLEHNVALDAPSHMLLDDLGPEPLGDDFNAAYLYRALRNKSLAVKNAIMDGHVVVGVGNIYASESLFRSRIHPETPAKTLTLAQCKKLVDEIKETLNDALAAGGSSLRDFFGADGNPGYFQQSYFVYGRTGEPCLICQTLIQNIRLGQRSTFFCPKCQPRKRLPKTELKSKPARQPI